MLKDDSWKVRQEIGSGGIAEIFLIERSADRQRAVLKRLRPALKGLHLYESSLQHEARIHATLCHPHIVKFHQVVDETSMILNYVDGVSLSTVIHRGGEFLWQSAAAIMIQLAAALSYLHSHSLPIIHNDLSPANLMVDRHGHLTLLDFGAACTTASSSRPRFVNRVWSAPEVCSQALSTQRSDVYSWGLLWMALLTNVEHRKKTPETLLKDWHDVVRRRQLPATLGSLVSGCLEPDPAERPRDGGDLVAACTHLRGNELSTIKRWVGRRIDGHVVHGVRNRRRRAAVGARWCLGLALCNTVIFPLVTATYFGKRPPAQAMPLSEAALPPALAHSTLIIDTHPWSAIYIDQLYRGITPLRIELKAGVRNLFVVAVEGMSMTMQLQIEPGEQVRVYRRFRP